jgi:hypothetical protein
VAELRKLGAALGELVLDVNLPGGQQAGAVDHLGSTQHLPGAGGVLARVEAVVDDLPYLLVVEAGQGLGAEDLRRGVEDGHRASLPAGTYLDKDPATDSLADTPPRANSTTRTGHPMQLGHR